MHIISACPSKRTRFGQLTLKTPHHAQLDICRILRQRQLTRGVGRDPEVDGKGGGDLDTGGRCNPLELGDAEIFEFGGDVDALEHRRSFVGVLISAGAIAGELLLEGDVLRQETVESLLERRRLRGILQLALSSEKRCDSE